MQRLRMLRGRAPGRAQRGAHHHGNIPVPARHVVYFGGLVHHLIHGQGQEVAEHDVDHRAQARHGRADANSSKAGFRNRRVDHALGAEFFHQSGEHFERRPGFGHILAEDAHPRVAAHFFGQRFAHRLRKCEFAFRHKRPAPLVDAGIRAPRWRTSPPLPFRRAPPPVILSSAAVSAWPCASSHFACSLMGSRSVFQCCSSCFER